MNSKIKFNKYFIMINNNNIENYDKSKLEKRYVTHDGQFHLDDLAASVIFSFLDNEKRLFIRSRESDIINMEGGTIFDVGGKYELENENNTIFLDHHQKDFDEKWNNKCKNKLAAFGLVLKHYGEEALTKLILKWNNKKKLDFDINDINKLVNSLYCNGWGKKVDASDNGEFESIIVSGDKSNRKTEEYFLDRTTLNFRIKRLYPKWWEDGDKKNWDLAFMKAFEIVRKELKEEIYFQALNIQNNKIKKKIIGRYFNSRNSYHSSGNILYLNKWMPYFSELIKLEKNNNLKDVIKFVIFKEKGKNKYLIQSFNNRILFDDNLRGLNEENDNEKIREICSLENISFIHKSGHIAGSNTLIDAYKLCEFILNKN
jgi:uncharacterized UPF0160 family protein